MRKLYVGRWLPWWEDGLALDHCHETGGFSGNEDDDDNSGDDNKIDYGSG